MLKKLLVLTAVAALAAMVGACGSSGDEGSSGRDREPAGADAETGAAAERAERPTPVEVVQVAYRETAAEQTAKTTFKVTTTGPPVDSGGSGQPAPMSMTMTGQGALDLSGGESTMTMEMFGMGAMEVRQVGNVAYTKMPREFVDQMPGAKPWLKVDLDAVAEQQYGAGAGFGQPQGGAAADPTRQLEYLRGVSDSVEKVGSERVRGVQTTRYRATIDMKQAAVEENGEARKAYDEMIRQTGVSKVPVEIWLDEQNRVRRYAMNMTMNVPENTASPEMSEGKMRMNMVAEYYDFGTPVDVQAPPPDQTMDASEMMPAQQAPA